MAAGGLRGCGAVGLLVVLLAASAHAQSHLSEQWAEYEGIVPRKLHHAASAARQQRQAVLKPSSSHLTPQLGLAQRQAQGLSERWAVYEGLEQPGSERAELTAQHRQHSALGTQRLARGAAHPALSGKKQLQGLRQVPKEAKSSELGASGDDKGLSDEWATFEHIEPHSAEHQRQHDAAKPTKAAAPQPSQAQRSAAQPAAHGARHHKLVAEHHRLPKLEGEADGEAAEGEEAEGDESKDFDPEDAAQTLQDYVEAHPAFAADAIAWLVAGIIIFVIACLVLLFSEVRVVLVVRDQDFRRDMQMRGYMQETERVKELEEKETASQAARPYLTGACMILLFISIICVLKPFCNVLDIIGLPSSNCFLTVGFGAFVGCVTVTTFIMGMCWSCTRGWAALVLLTIAITGDLMCTTGVPFLVLLWLLFAGGLFFYYFIYLPETADCPSWCQAIGPMKASMDPVEWKKAAHSSASASLEDLSGALASLPGGQSLAEAASQAAERARNAENKDGSIDKSKNTATV